MKRILVIGSGGAGKSTIARAIAERLPLPLVHLDELYWRPGWTPMPTGEWEQLVCEQVAAPEWVMDGNYGGTLDARLARCDTVVFLDVPRLVCLWRVVKRDLQFRGRDRPDMAPGCPERLSLEFVWWIWTYPARRRRGILEKLAALRPDQRVFVLSSRSMVRDFLDLELASDSAPKP